MIATFGCLLLLASSADGLQRAPSRSLTMATGSKKKIVVTGIGAVTPVGIGGHVAFDAMVAGKCGIKRLPSWADEYPAQVSNMLKSKIVHSLTLLFPCLFSIARWHC